MTLKGIKCRRFFTRGGSSAQCSSGYVGILSSALEQGMPKEWNKCPPLPFMKFVATPSIVFKYNY